MALSKHREELLKWALWGATHEPSIHYTMGTDRDDWLQKRPKLRKHKAPKLPLRMDCSGFVTLCYYLSGLPDPNGLKYEKLGYTGTLLAHCKHIPKSKVKVGDLIVYGPETGHHVVIVIGRQKGTIMTVSHGQERGPFKISHLLEDQYQPEPERFLRVPGVA